MLTALVLCDCIVVTVKQGLRVALSKHFNENAIVVGLEPTRHDCTASLCAGPINCSSRLHGNGKCCQGPQMACLMQKEKHQISDWVIKSRACRYASRVVAWHLAKLTVCHSTAAMAVIEPSA